MFACENNFALEILSDNEIKIICVRSKVYQIIVSYSQVKQNEQKMLAVVKFMQ